MANSLRVGLKEWASVCGALDRGRQIVLLRKGGIYEASGEFEVEHRQFVLFPTYLHQAKNMLKASEHGDFRAVTSEPKEVRISTAGEVSDIIQLTSRSQMDVIEGEHIWTGALIDMRFNYRPENPLYLMLVRVWRIKEPVAIENSPAYAGCKSWVPLESAIDTRGATAVIDDAAYEARRGKIFKALR